MDIKVILCIFCRTATDEHCSVIIYAFINRRDCYRCWPADGANIIIFDEELSVSSGLPATEVYLPINPPTFGLCCKCKEAYIRWFKYINITFKYSEKV